MAMRRWLRHMRAVLERRGPDLGDLEKQLVSVFRVCHLPYPSRRISLRTRRSTFRSLQRIVQVSTDTQLSQLEMKHLVWSAIGAYCFFRGVGERAGFWSREHLNASRFYLLVMQRLLNCSYESQDAIVQCVFGYLSEFTIWPRESLALSTLLRPLFAGATGDVVLNQLLDRLQTALATGHSRGTIPRPCHIVRVMYGLFDLYDWPPLDDSSAKVITRLLKTYRKALREEICGGPCGAEPAKASGAEAGAEAGSEAGAEAGSSEYRQRAARVALRKGLEVTIRRIVEHMANADIILIISYMVEWIFDSKNSEEVILTFGMVLEHAAMVYVTGTFEETFVEPLFSNLLLLLGADNPAVSVLANRVLQQLLDRHSNRREFASPRIFFQNTHFNVHVAVCLAEDRAFLRVFRKAIHSNMMHAVLVHSEQRHMLESLYTTICLFATEVPCGYSATVFANLAMNIQGAARNNEELRAITRFQLHGLVMGIMSLLCWLHNAPDFYEYVNKVMDLRAEHAPHLNPPLRMWYTFARHHVLFDRAELFFDAWEVRYCLWMRFKIQHTQTFLEAMCATAPPTAAELAAVEASGMEPSLAARVVKLTRRQELQPFLPVRDPSYDVAAARGDALNLETDPRLLEISLEDPLEEVL